VAGIVTDLDRSAARFDGCDAAVIVATMAPGDARYEET